MTNSPHSYRAKSYATDLLFISYWRCNITKRIRVMEFREFATPVAVTDLALNGNELSDEDVQAAEALLAKLRDATHEGTK